jgi:flagellar basal-body rod protein FlgC
MGLFDSLAISASGLSAERLRMDVTAENLANAQSTQGPDGQPYRRKEVVLQAMGSLPPGNSFQTVLDGAIDGRTGAAGTSAGAGVQVAAIVEDENPGRRIYDPGHPDADGQGYVTMPNVDSVTEMVDLISSSRAYEANVTAMQTAKQMFTKTLELLR